MEQKSKQKELTLEEQNELKTLKILRNIKEILNIKDKKVLIDVFDELDKLEEFDNIDYSLSIVLDENIKEIVAEGDVNLNVYLPEKTWLGWRCIINFSEADTIEAFDVGTPKGDMFGIDAQWSGITAGKTYLLAKIKKDDGSPAAYNMYEVDNITRQIINN